MKNLFRKRFYVRGQNHIETSLLSFTIGQRLLFFSLTCLMALTALIITFQISDIFSTTIPTNGGSFKEGVIGSPRFINPILAISDTDRDLTSLIFSGLMRATPDGQLKPELAESYEISPDGLNYTFKIRSDASFHDGEPITADDIIFTIEKTKDPIIKSPKRAEWEGVQITKIDDKTISFTLSKPYFPFIENTTIGIIPKHLWKDVGSEEFPFSLQNIKPVGSGPFMIKKINNSKNGIPTNYKLTTFKNFTNKPYIEQIEIIFYRNENDIIKAWQNGEIDSFGSISPESAKNIVKKVESRVLSFNLPRIFGVFFNQNQQNLFTDKNVRKALELSVDKDNLVKNILSGYGQVLNSPIPNNLLNKQNVEHTPNTKQAIKLLEKSGWKLKEKNQLFRTKTSKNKTSQELSFALSLPNIPELKAVANNLKTQWQAIGVNVEIKLFELGDLNQNVIRPRNYDALLFGEVIGRNPDLSSFWHSSQRNDPGYNIALYTNTKVDKLLEQIKTESDLQTRASLLETITQKIQKDVPAIFLYSPDYLYIPPKNIKGLQVGIISSPNERFGDISKWYIKTQSYWPFLNKIIHFN